MIQVLTFGSVVKERRQHLGLTQAELARRANCAAITIRQIEADAMNPSLQIVELLAEALKGMGCPAEKCAEMAAQLDKRARQLAPEKGGYEPALKHLLTLMAQGWAAPK